MNKVLVFRDANREKGQRTVCQWLADMDPSRYEMSNLTMPSGVPIKRVRRLRNELTIKPIRESGDGRAYIKPGSTHHLAFFECQHKGKRKCEAVFVTMLEAVDRLKVQQREFQRNSKSMKRQSAGS